MARETYYIARWTTPIGEFSIDEGFQIHLDGEVVGGQTTLPACIDEIQSIYNDRRKSEVTKLNNRIAEINSMEMLIDSYRQKL